MALRNYGPAELRERAKQVADRQAQFAAGVGGRERIRAALIADDFTRLSLMRNWEVENLRPQAWMRQLEDFRPELLFVESAWRGIENTWTNTVGRFPAELAGIVQWCRENGVPSVFWNKEDPVHFDGFIRTAAEFDHVFTSDVDSVGRYREALGHARVHVLPFATEPTAHNPIERYERKDKLVFAGAYYKRYPDRARDLGQILNGALNVMDVDIYDRNFGTDDERYRFPDEYEQYILGTLPPSEIALAYKGYRYGLTLNSVKSSQTMLARRVFELMSSGTLVISNYARALRLLLGDLVAMSDSSEGTSSALRALVDDPERADRLRTLCLRVVLESHTMAERLRYVISVVAGTPYAPTQADVAVLAPAADMETARRALASVRAQQGVNARVTFVTASEEVACFARREGHDVLAEAQMHQPLSALAPGDTPVGVLDPRDWHGAHHLQSLIQSWQYSDADVVGRSDRFVVRERAVERVAAGTEFRENVALDTRAALLRGEAASKVTVREWLEADTTDTFAELSTLSAARFDYVRDGALLNEVPLAGYSSDLELWTGVSVTEIFERTDRALRGTADGPGLLVDPDEFPTGGHLGAHGGNVALRRLGTVLGVRSTLGPTETVTVWARGAFAACQVWSGGEASIALSYAGDPQVKIVLEVYDTGGNPVLKTSASAARGRRIELPAEAAYARVGVEVRGPGDGLVRRLHLEDRNRDEPVLSIPTSRTLLVTNIYPSYDRLYANGFVHSRVRAYRRAGMAVDIFAFGDGPSGYREFDGIDVQTGLAPALRRALRDGNYDTIAVHFLLPEMWEVLQEFAHDSRVVIWLHGYEAAMWYRRPAAYAPEALASSRALSADRRRLWRRIFRDSDPNVHFVFVSEYFADCVQQDIGVSLDRDRYSVIPNPIDTTRFQYREKSAAARTKILSIRPYQPLYANDLAVRAVHYLANEPFFEQLEFTFVGDGPLFEQTLSSLRGYPNVRIERGFITQSEIADLHAEHGVFLVPTRCDSHGVSRDEAMASGLVPVTTDACAVPEFVDEESALVAPPEDARTLADHIATIYHDPELFLKLSKGAARRVRSRTAGELIIGEELRLLRDGHVEPASTSVQLGKPSARARIDVAVLGSYVVRDAFAAHGDRISPPVAHFSSSALASAMGKEILGGDVRASGLTAEFQRQSVENDVRSKFRRYVSSGSYDILLYDLLDERFDLLLLDGGGTATCSSDYERSGLCLRVVDVVGVADEEYFRRWESAWSEFVGLLDVSSQISKLRISKTFWSDAVVGGAPLPVGYSPERIRRANSFLQRAHERIAQDIDERHIYSFTADDLLVSPIHKWGPAPFHFVPSYYERLVGRLVKEAESVGPCV